MEKLRPTYDIGYEGYAVTGEKFKVIKYEGRKKIKIKFECGLVRNTTSTHIKQNRVKYSHKKVNPYKVGDLVTNRDSTVKGVIISIDTRRNRYKIEFENGNIKTYAKGSIFSKDITDQDLVKIKEGDVFETNNFGSVTVTKYEDAHNVHIVFEDGTESKVQASSLRLGNIGHPKSGVPEGFTFVNGDGCKGTVVRFGDCFDVEVEWELGGITNHNAACVKQGAAYCPNYKSVAGVGYFGIGKYKPNRSGRTPNYNKRVYESWQRMIRRCYDKKEQKKSSCAAYKNVKVCEEWHNFQNFALWAEDKEDKFVEGWELDKDMFGNGKLYCPSFCTLLPNKVNWFLCDGYSNKKSGLPEGVNIVHPKTKNSKTGYIARCHVNGQRKYLGFYDSPHEAAMVYKEAKESEARRIAEQYKHLLTKDQYNKLIHFKLEDIHRK